MATRWSETRYRVGRQAASEIDGAHRAREMIPVPLAETGDILADDRDVVVVHLPSVDQSADPVAVRLLLDGDRRVRTPHELW